MLKINILTSNKITRVLLNGYGNLIILNTQLSCRELKAREQSQSLIFLCAFNRLCAFKKELYLLFLLLC